MAGNFWLISALDSLSHTDIRNYTEQSSVKVITAEFIIQDNTAINHLEHRMQMFEEVLQSFLGNPA